MYRHLIVLIILFAQCVSREKTTPSLDSLKNTIVVFNESFSRYDVDVLTSLTTENYLHANDSSEPIGKEDWLAYLNRRRGKMEEGALTITKYVLSDTVMRVHGATVVVSGKMSIEGVEDQVPFSTVLRVTKLLGV